MKKQNKFDYKTGGITPNNLIKTWDGKFIVAFDETLSIPTFTAYGLSIEGIFHDDIISLYNPQGEVLGGGRLLIVSDPKNPFIQLSDRSTEYGGVPFEVAYYLGESIRQNFLENARVRIQTHLLEFSEGEEFTRLGFTQEDHERQKLKHLEDFYKQ
jgi:hypothetical protein